MTRRTHPKARFVWMTIVLFAVLAGGPAAAQPAAVKRLPVEASGGAATGRAVEFCLPLAEGELAESAALRVIADDREVPSQVTVLSTWPKDKSLRVLWVRAVAPPAGAALAVEFGRGVTRAAAGTPLRVEKSQNGVTVTTGPLRLSVSSRELKALDQVWLDLNGDGTFADDEAVLAAEGVRPVLTTLDGGNYAPVGPPTVTVEESGPVCAVVCVKGELAPADRKDAAEEERFQVTCRVKTYAGSESVWIQHILRRPGRRFGFPGPTKPEVEREWSLLVPVDASGLRIHLRAGRPQLSYASGGAGKVIDAGELAKDAKKLILAGGDFARNSPSVRFDGEGPGKAGSLEWLDVSAGGAGVAAAVRDAAVLFPKACELSGSGAVQIDLWKDDPPRAVLEIGSGYYRAHDVVLLFHAGGPRQAAGERACALTAPVRAAVPARQFRTSGVFGPLPEGLDGLPPGFDELQQTLVARDGGSRPRFGESAYGSTSISGVRPDGRSGYSGGSYNALAVRGALFALYGTRDYLDDVDRMGRWTRDWDLKHRKLLDGTPVALCAEPSNTLVLFIPSAAAAKETFPGQNAVFQALKEGKRRLGVVQPASWCRGGPCQRSRDVPLEGMLYHYYLTGDPASGDTAREAADLFHWLGTCPEDFGNPRHIYYTGFGHRFHVGGKFMLNLMIAYESLGDAKYLDATKTMWKYMLQTSKASRKEFPRDDERYWEATSMMSWPHQATNFLRPARQLYRWTGDESLKEYSDKLADALVAERWDAGRRQFWKGVHTNDVGQDTVVKGRIYLDSQSLPLASGLAYCWLLTGRKQHMEVIREAYDYSAGRIREMKAAGKFNYDINAGSLLTSFQALVGAFEAAERK